MRWLLSLWASILFYTSIPLPYVHGLDFQGVARFVPVVGLLIGGILGLVDGSWGSWGMPVITRRALVGG